MASSASQPVPTPALSEPQPSHPTPVINVIPAPPTDPPAAPAKKDPQFLAPVKPPSRKKRAGRDRNLVRKTRQKGTLDTRPPVYDGHWVHPHEARPEPHKRCFHDALRQLGHREEAPPHSVARRLRRDAHWLKFWSSPVDLLGKGQRQQALPDQGSDADAHGDTVEPEMEDGQRVLDEAIRERDEMSSRPHSAREKPMRYLFAKRAHRQREHAEASAAAAAAAATEAAVPQNSVEVPRSQQLRQTIICLRRESPEALCARFKALQSPAKVVILLQVFSARRALLKEEQGKKVCQRKGVRWPLDFRICHYQGPILPFL